MGIFSAKKDPLKGLFEKIGHIMAIGYLVKKNPIKSSRGEPVMHTELMSTIDECEDIFLTLSTILLKIRLRFPLNAKEENMTEMKDYLKTYIKNAPIKIEKMNLLLEEYLKEYSSAEQTPEGKEHE